MGKKNLIRILVEGNKIVEIEGAPKDAVFKIVFVPKANTVAFTSHKCEDFIKEITDKKKVDCSSAICLVCGSDNGWYCPDSPTHICEYAPGDVCNDSCIHCGDPEERK